MQSYNLLLEKRLCVPKKSFNFVIGIETITIMRKFILIGMMLVAMSAAAQTNLAGRIYYHPNIMADAINQSMKEIESNLDKAKSEAIAKVEKEKGRKLTAVEMDELEKKMEEAQQMVAAMKDGMKTAVTVKFKDEKNVILKADVKMDEAVLKSAGIGWAKRKLMMAASAMAPAERGTYVVMGDLVIMNDGHELDTLRLSDNGKYLSGKLDEKKKFKLTRIQ